MKVTSTTQLLFFGCFLAAACTSAPADKPKAVDAAGDLTVTPDASPTPDLTAPPDLTPPDLKPHPDRPWTNCPAPSCYMPVCAGSPGTHCCHPGPAAAAYKCPPSYPGCTATCCNVPPKACPTTKFCVSPWKCYCGPSTGTCPSGWMCETSCPKLAPVCPTPPA